MSYDYSKLLGRIVEKQGTRAKFAAEMDISERSLSLKLNDKVPWKDAEISKACNILDIEDSEMHLYFFKYKVL